MTKKADIGGKRLISLATDEWSRWVTGNPQIQAREIIDTAFQWIGRESDVIIRASSPQEGEFLLLNELQLRYSTKMPRRMLAYAGLATEKYGLPVYPVLINILPPRANIEICSLYSAEFAGLRTLLEYRVINLWEVDAEIVFERSLTPLLPFVPILRGGGQTPIVRRAWQQLHSDEQLNELEPLLAFFATFVLESAVVQEIMRWDMAILRESPWYNEILQEGTELGIEQGIEQGRQQGIEQGRQQEILEGIELGLELKFGAAGRSLMPEIRQIQDLETLKQIRSSLRTVESLEQLRQFYG
jgi:predicted transposase YdaD